MISPRDKLEPRGDHDPKFDPHNATDKKIVTVVIVSCLILILFAVGLFLLYFLLK